MNQEVQWLLKEKYRGENTDAFKEDCRRLERGEHIAYVIGFVDFLGATIDLSLKPLIPRPETEFWVGEAIKSLKKRNGRKKIQCLDIFSGSGCIGVSILRHVPEAHVNFSDNNEKFLNQIRLNAKNNTIEEDRYELVQSDVFSDIREKYDYILANPPYIDENKKTEVDESVLKNDPARALFAGDGGMYFVKKVLHEGIGFLNPGGVIYAEFDSHQKEALEKFSRDLPFAEVSFFKDQYGEWRYLRAVRNTSI